MDGPNSVNYFCGLGQAFYSIGNFEQALKYYEKALAISDKERREGYLDTATIYNNMRIIDITVDFAALISCLPSELLQLA